MRRAPDRCDVCKLIEIDDYLKIMHDEALWWQMTSNWTDVEAQDWKTINPNSLKRFCHLGHGLTLILTRVKKSHTRKVLDDIIHRNPNRQRRHWWNLGKDKLFHPTHYDRCNHLYMLGRYSMLAKGSSVSTIGNKFMTYSTSHTAGHGWGIFGFWSQTGSIYLFFMYLFIVL